MLAEMALIFALGIQGASSCPSAADVEREVLPLLPLGFAEGTADQVALHKQPNGDLQVSLTTADGVAPSVKILPASMSCAERADAVAVLIAIWEARVHPEISLRLERLNGDGAPIAIVSSVDPSGPPTDRAGLVALPPTSIGLGVGIVGLSSPAPQALGARLDLSADRVDRRWRGRLSAVALGSRTIAVPPGEASWWRAYASLGGDALFAPWRLWTIAVGAGGVVGGVDVGGSGYPTNQRGWNVDLGVETSARVERRVGRLRPWAGLALLTWFRQQRVEVTGESNGTSLPRLDLTVAVGFDFLWGG